MDFENITFYPEFWIDIIVYIVVGVALVLLSKCLWDWREERRLRKETAAWQQRRDDEARDE